MTSSLGSKTPVSLLERLRHGTDQESWRRFVLLYTPLLFHWARRLNFSPNDAADRVQDVLLLLYQKLPQFQYDARHRFRGWLWKVFRNKCRDHVRQRDILQDAAEADSALEANGDGVPEWIESEYRQHLFNRAIELIKAEFPEKTWRACWEYVAKDRPAAEVAVELNLSVDQVYKAKTRVLQRLRGELDGLWD